MKTVKLSVMYTVLLIGLAAISQADVPNASPEWWGKAPGQKPIISGTVVNISPTNIAIKTSRGVKPFTASDKTKVMIRGQKASLADIKVGDHVIVHFRLMKNNVPFAVGVVVPRVDVKGKLVAVSQGEIVIRTDKGDRHVVVNGETIYRSRAYKGSINDLVVGYRVAAHVDVNGETSVARAVEFMPAVAKGTVTAVDGDAITVKTVRQLVINLQAGPATAVLVRPRVGPNVKGTLADIKVGAPVNIGFHSKSDGASPLLWVDVLTGM